MKQNWGLLGIFLVLCTACQKDKTIVELKLEDPNPPSAWTLDQQFQFKNKIKLNSFATSDKLYLIGPGSFTGLEATEDTTVATHFFLPYDYPIQHKMTIKEDVFVGVGNSTVGFFSPKNPVLSGHNIWVNLKNYDPDFALLELPSYQSGIGPAINNQNVCLVPFLTFFEIDGVQVINGNEHKYALIQLDVRNSGGSSRIDTTSVTIIDPIEGAGPFLLSQSFGDYFYLTLSEATLRMDSEGNQETIFPGRFVKMLTQNNELFAFTDNELYRSNMEGLDWQLLGSPDSNFKQLNYAEVDGQLIGYYFNQLFALEITETEIKVTELEQEGLEGHEITSVVGFNEKVYVTTLTGVFHRPMADFFEPKKEE